MASRPQGPDFEITPMMKKRGCLIAAVLVVGVIGLACYGFVQATRKLELGFSSPYVFVSTGATEEWQTHFLTEGFQDRGIYLLVRPVDESPDNLVLVADLAWFANYFDTAVWSGDGSVIACRANVGIREDATESARKEQDLDHVFQPIVQHTFFACAYDFRQGETIVLRHPCESSRAEWEVHSKTIEELLKSRGGLGKEISSNEIKEQSTKLDWALWQVYQNARRRRVF